MRGHLYLKLELKVSFCCQGQIHVLPFPIPPDSWNVRVMPGPGQPSWAMRQEPHVEDSGGVQ